MCFAVPAADGWRIFFRLRTSGGSGYVFWLSNPERLAVFHSFFDGWRVCVRFSDEFSRIASDSPPIISETLEFPPVIWRRGWSKDGEVVGQGRHTSHLASSGTECKKEKAVLVAVLDSRYWRVIFKQPF